MDGKKEDTLSGWKQGTGCLYMLKGFLAMQRAGEEAYKALLKLEDREASFHT